MRTPAQTCHDNFVEKSAKKKRFRNYSDAFKDASQKLHDNRQQGLTGKHGFSANTIAEHYNLLQR